MDKKEFEKKFRELIKPDTSNWKERPAVDRGARDEFRRSQRVASRILEFLEKHEDWSRQRLADELGVTIQRIGIIVQGKANFTLQTIEKMEGILGINLLDEPKQHGVKYSHKGIDVQNIKLPSYRVTGNHPAALNVSFDPMAITYFEGHWFYTQGVTYEPVLAGVLAGESNFGLAA